MKCNRMEIEVTIEEILDIIRRINEAGINEHQQHDRGTQAGANTQNRLLMLATIKRSQRHHENEQRAEMKRQMIQIISTL